MHIIYKINPFIKKRWTARRNVELYMLTVTLENLCKQYNLTSKEESYDVIMVGILKASRGHNSLYVKRINGTMIGSTIYQNVYIGHGIP